MSRHVFHCFLSVRLSEPFTGVFIRVIFVEIGMP